MPDRKAETVDMSDTNTAAKTDPFEDARRFMVETQIVDRGVLDPLVLGAMRTVPRHEFVAKSSWPAAYDDRPLPIGDGQTISQPYVVAFMIEALGLKGGERVLEVGVGSGYAVAVLAEIAGEVYGIERIGQLAQLAARNLTRAGYDHVHILHDDGTRGWAAHAPYDAILVSAGGPAVPPALKEQLVEGGRLVVPVGEFRHTQQVVRVTRRSDDRYETENLAGVHFVPLIGEQGWDGNGADQPA